MTVDLLELGRFLLLMSLTAFFIYMTKLIHGFTKTIKIWNEVSVLAKEAVILVNHLLKKTDKMADNVSEIVSESKNVVHSIGDSISSSKGKMPFLKWFFKPPKTK